MKPIIIFIVFIFSNLCFSQGEANNWYFGENAGITFNSGNPVALIDGQLNTYEGCASISDSNGQLLFYTNGISVWNKNHQFMVNGTGLLGSQSSTQSATIVPKPGSSNLYYMFTLDAEAGIINGFRYSVIDMLQDSGNGAVTSEKNIFVYSPSCEKIGIIKHANGLDYWVVIHDFGTNSFFSYLLTSSELSSSPIISATGFVPNVSTTGSKFSSIGYLKIASDGSKVAIVHAAADNISAGVLQLLNFNNATGTVFNPITLLTEFGEMYGVEFSPNRQLLYFTDASFTRIIQFDLSAADIPSSQIIINTVNNPGALQLGPDGKIYVAFGNKYYLGVINSPNSLGLACSFTENGVYLDGKRSFSGLPAFNQSFFAPSIILENSCLGEATTFQVGDSSTTSAIWNFGDGNTSTNLSPTHTYSTTGTYTVSVTATNAYGTGTNTRDIIISQVPTASQPQNLTFCDDNNDGFHVFDLTNQKLAILNGQSTTQFDVRYFANATDYTSNIAIAAPNSFANITSYQQQTIIAEVYNTANGNCKATTTFTIQVFESHLPSITVSAIRKCDNTSFGTDSDGRVVFDLTQRQTEILNGQSATAFSVQYYTDSGFLNQIINISTYVNTNSIETIYIKVVNNQNASCFATTSFQIEVYSLPVLSSTTVSLKQCDDNNDGFSAFNLAEANILAVASTTGLTFSYFETFALAQSNSTPITNSSSYTNQIVSNDVIYMRVQNANGCYKVATLNLIVSTTLIPALFQLNYTECDDFASGTNTDGFAVFDFSNATSQIQALYPSGQLLDITYYKNITDALAENNAITNISNYTNIGYPNTQDIYVRVDSQLNNECLGLGHHITLNVERIPIVQPQIIIHCDDDQDGSYAFDTSTLETTLLNGLTNVVVTYTNQSGNPIILTNPFVSTSQTLNVLVKNTYGKQCDFSTTVQFVVDDLPEAFSIPTTITTFCDDEMDPALQNGSYPFDTTTFQSTILGTQTGMVVNYYDQNNTILSSPLPNPFNSTTQTLTVEVINPANSICKATMTIPLVVNPNPIITLTGSELVCSDNPNFTKVIDAGLVDVTTISNYTYSWFLNGTLLPNENNYTLTVNTEGIYTVEVLSVTGCISTRTITVTASNIATINQIQVSDLADENSIVVLVSNGNYEYSIDNEYYQSSTTFSNILPGVYTVYVRDLDGCGIATQEVSVLGIPKYFTPNGDGINDYWNIKGFSQNSTSTVVIAIFDRFGKLITTFTPLNMGWDGTYNKKLLVSDDYWYSIELEGGRIVKGHFSLKR